MTNLDIDKLWNELLIESDSIVGNEFVFNMRVRYNVQRSQEERIKETQAFWAQQVEKFKALKAKYIVHREALLKATIELYPRRKELAEQLEKCIVDDMERIVLGSN